MRHACPLLAGRARPAGPARTSYCCCPARVVAAPPRPNPVLWLAIGLAPASSSPHCTLRPALAAPRTRPHPAESPVPLPCIATAPLAPSPAPPDGRPRSPTASCAGARLPLMPASA
nr:vegetative cell wall protein gp1-like [Aegilops tauschii subsp. strangulata]